MNHFPDVPTQPEPEAIARAGDLLEAILSAGLDIEAILAIGAALARLYDVYPPYPPRPEPTFTIDLHTGISQALQALAEHTPSTVAESIRIALAARELRPLRQRQ